MIGLLYWVVYASAWVQLRHDVERRRQRLRVTWWGVALWLAVAVPSLLQFLWPDVLVDGTRDDAAIAQGEWWRLFTSMFLQDGGWAGTVFNLVTLAVTALLAGSLARGWVLPVLFLLGGVVCNALTTLTFAQPGAGNSMATMVLAVVVAIWVVRRAALDLVVAALLVATATTLLFVRDMHGIAVGCGLLLGAASRHHAKVLPSVRRHADRA